MFRHFFNKILSSQAPDSEPWLLNEAFKLYLKNIVVGLFCSVFMMLFPYLQFVLIRNNAPVPMSALLVFAAAFLSVAFLYTPFITSVHRARISKIWSAIWYEVLAIAIYWAFFHSALFLFAYTTRHLCGEICAIVCILFLLLSIVFWQTMLFKLVLVIYKKTSEKSLKISLFNLFTKNKALFMEAYIFNIGLLLFVPYFTEQFFLRKFGLTSDWSEEQKIEYSQNAPVLIMFLILPLTVILSYACMCNAVKKNT